MSAVSQISLTRFEVTFLYGFIADIDEEVWAKYRDTLPRHASALGEGTGPLDDVRDGWASMYRSPRALGNVVQRRLPDLPGVRLPHDPKWWPSGQELGTDRIEAALTLRQDGTGVIALTVEFSVEADGRLFCTTDVLHALAMAPRSQRGGTVRVEILAEENGKLLDDPELHGYSVLYKLFRYLLREYLADLKVKDLFQSPDDGEDRPPLPVTGTLHEGASVLDPQMPYSYVLGTMPFGEYSDAFLETRASVDRLRSRRRRYTKDIAAILGRWLAEQNIPHASLDYWEERGLARRGVFRSQYMNSLVFTTFSGFATLSLSPALQDQAYSDVMQVPIRVTRETILRCLEFSRLRWYHALYLSAELDGFIRRVANASRPKSLLDLYGDYAVLESQLALHVCDPNAYLWDASVGSRLSEYLHGSVIEGIETELLKKDRHVKSLLENRLRLIQAREYIEYLDGRPASDKSVAQS